MIKTTQIEELVNGYCDSISKRNGVFTFKRTYFYRHGATTEGFVRLISRQLEKAGYKFTILDSGDNWQRFPKDSYFWVKLQFDV